MVHTYNPSYLEGEALRLDASWGKKLVRPHLNNKKQTGYGGVYCHPRYLEGISRRIEVLACPG
jgi:hypothetical protein